MGIRLIADINRVDEILESVSSMDGKEIEVGILSSASGTMLKIANAHEYGTTITPKNGRYLSIPLSRKYKDKSPRSISGLFVIKSRNGNLFLAKKKGRSDLEFCYILKDKVEIPERSFVRSAFDERLSRIEDFMKQLMERVISSSLPAQDVLDLLGDFCSTQVKEQLTDISSPANTALTRTIKGSSNPLIDTGHLRDSVTYEVR